MEKEGGGGLGGKEHGVLTLSAASLGLRFPGLSTTREVEASVQLDGLFGVESADCGGDFGVAPRAVPQRLTFEAAAPLRGLLRGGQNLQLPLQAMFVLFLLIELRIHQIKHPRHQSHLQRKKRIKGHVSVLYEFSPWEWFKCFFEFLYK